MSDGGSAATARGPRRRTTAARLRSAAWLAALIPAGYLGVQLARALGGLPNGLGREPVRGLEHATGATTIRFLAATLATSPLRRLTGWSWLAPYRRLLGLATFGYASAHLATYAVLDLELQLGDVAAEIAKRPYLLVGFAAWLLLVPLAVTSTAGWIRRLGGRRWRALHRATYAVAALALAHFWMSQKKDHTEVVAWATVFALLFAARGVRWNAVGIPTVARVAEDRPP